MRLLHDNIRPHVERNTKALLDKFGWDILLPPFSPDLPPSDYHLFTYLKKHMGGKKPNSNEAVNTVVKEYLKKEVDGGLYDVGI